MPLHLSSDALEVAVAPEHGFTITSITLAGDDENVLWSPQGASLARLPDRELGPAGEASITHFDRNILVGGWFPMFPTAGPPGGVSHVWMHGELPRIAWKVDTSSKSEVTASATTPASGMEAHRTVRLVEDTVHVLTSVINQSGRAQQVTFGEHPCFARQVFASGRLLLRPTLASTGAPADNDNSVLVPDQHFDWPTARAARGGGVNLADVPTAADGRHDHISLVGVASALVCGKRHTLDISWDAAMMPNALLWQHFRPVSSPWDGDVFALEPMSAPGRTYQDAVTSGNTLTIQAEETITFSMSMRVTRANSS